MPELYSREQGSRSVTPKPVPKCSVVMHNISPSTSTQPFTVFLPEDASSSLPTIQISDISTSIRSQDTLLATSPATLDTSLPTLTPTAPTVSAPDIVAAMLSWEAASSVSPSLQDASPPTSTTTSPAIASHSSDIFMSILPEDMLHPPDSGLCWNSLGWQAYMQALGALKEVSVVFPPLQVVTAGLLCMLEQIEEIKDARNDLRVMARRIEALVTLLRRYQRWTNDEDIHNQLDGTTMSVIPVVY
ncbi:hypothetical protein B0H10DRAFT_1958710 [Mycena sp. CBHHK59/15]|nr:hypothetical protein B0H10DRAFT_1958710 [Mycena sp. CBHHK59/15]